MNSNLLTISLYCRSERKKTNNQVPLYLRLSKDSQRKLIALNLWIDLKYWDSKKKEIKPNCPDLNYYQLIIEEKKQAILKKALQTNLGGEELHLDELLHKKEREERQFVKQHFEVYIKELESEERIRNAKYYICCLNCLLDFTNGKNLEFKQIDVVFLNEYAHWMLTVRKLHKNTVGNRLKGLKAIFNRAITSKQISRDIYPFDEFKVTKFREETVKRAISKSAVSKIMNIDLKRISDKQNFQYFDFARDIFVFSYLGCGINLIDMALLKYENIIDNERIQFRRRKTKKLISFKLLPQTREIIEKYRKPESLLTDYMFPIITYGKHETVKDIYNRITFRTKMINKYLNAMGVHLGIPLKLTSYVARHSFASILKRSGVQTSIISEAMGHSSEKVTQIYLDSFDNEQIDKAMQHLL